MNRSAMIPRYHPRTLYEQAQWRILRRRARLTGKTIEELVEEDRKQATLTIETAPPPPALTPADLETLIRELVPAIAKGVRGEVVSDMRETLERISREASAQTGSYIAQEVARRLALRGAVVASPGQAGSAAAPADAGAPPVEAQPPAPRIPIGDIQSLIDMLNKPRPPRPEA